MSKHRGGHWVNTTQNKRSLIEYKMREQAKERDRIKNTKKENKNYE